MKIIYNPTTQVRIFYKDVKTKVKTDAAKVLTYVWWYSKNIEPKKIVLKPNNFVRRELVFKTLNLDINDIKEKFKNHPQFVDLDLQGVLLDYKKAMLFQHDWLEEYYKKILTV